MNKADKYLYEAIDNILVNGYKDKNPRPHYEDGTPAHTISVNHVFRTYDISKGEFPITSLRPIAWKTAIKEILAIYQCQSNKIEDFEKMGCFWWKDWALEDGTIGKAYPYNLESHRPDEMKKSILKVKKRVLDPSLGRKHSNEQFEREAPVDDTVYLDRYQVLGVDKTKKCDKNHYYCRIQFISNNYKTSLREDSIGKSNGVNPYDRTVYGIGYLGEYKKYIFNLNEDEVKKIKVKWDSMMERGYSQVFKMKHPSYKDVFVHYDWHCFANFLKDVWYIPQFHLAREEKFIGWDLDKDYYGSNCYSKDTCVFLKHEENSLYNKVIGYYKIVDTISNKVYYEINLTDFSRKIDVPQNILQKAVSTKGQYKNFSFELVKEEEGYVYRYELSRNQLNELIKGIIENPYSRRHIISFWNWANIDKKSLVECAYETIWNVREDKYLDMILIQRSGDLLTASCAGVNEIQYTALLMMIAKATGYEPGVFSHFIANEQLYDRHLDAAKELQARYEANLSIPSDYGIPKLVLDTDKTNFYDFTIDDFRMENYYPVKPQLKLELGI